jgi:hypothetical protein
VVLPSRRVRVRAPGTRPDTCSEVFGSWPPPEHVHGSPSCGFVTLRDVLADSSPDIGMMGVLGIPVGLRAAFFRPVTVE